MSEAEVASAACFIDTNIWLYAFIEGDLQKCARAKSLLQREGHIYVSTQVINEVCVDLLRQAQLSENQIRELIESFYTKCSVVELDKMVSVEASNLRERYALSFWDSVIVGSALRT